MIDNLNTLLPLLNFEEEGDFYRLHIFKRKKDQTTDKANHQSVRTIKSYSIYNKEYLEEKYEEIKHLCEHFKARAYLGIQRLNDKSVSLNMIKALANNLESGNNKCERLYDSVVGKMHSKTKRWIVDIDDRDVVRRVHIIYNINELDPIGGKILTQIPTKSGYHLITKPFRLDKFKETYSDIDVQKNNPTVLYIPKSLD